MNENIIRILVKISFVLLFSYPVCGISQEIEDNPDIKRLIRPLTNEGIFRDSVYYNRGGSIIKGEGKDIGMKLQRITRKSNILKAVIIYII